MELSDISNSSILQFSGNAFEDRGSNQDSPALGTGLHVDIYLRRRIAGFPKKDVDLSKTLVDLSFF